MVTLEDVAERVGVSASAVSLTLFNRAIDARTGHRRVSVETETRIRKVAKEMHYVPNMMARGMRKRQTFTIALVVNSISTSFYSNIIEGLTDVIEAKGYHLLICHSDRSHERELRHLTDLQRKQVDGVVIAPVLSKGKSHLKKGIQNFKGKPVLLLGYNPIHHPFAIVFDDAAACKKAVDYLYRQGHRGIGFVPSSLECDHTLREAASALPVRKRLQAYQKAIRKCGLPSRVYLHREQFLADIRSGALTAIVAAADEVAASLYPVLREAKLKIPKDLSVVSLGDTPVAPLLDPPLTAICLPKVELGIQAGKMMLRAIEQKQFSLEVMSMDLIERKSCRAPRSKAIFPSLNKK